MTRSLYFLGGLFAMALVLFAQMLQPAPTQRAGATATERPSGTTPVHDPATAIDDLAAWPAAASR
jgi:hypothetical protein